MTNEAVAEWTSMTRSMGSKKKPRIAGRSDSIRYWIDAERVDIALG